MATGRRPIRVPLTGTLRVHAKKHPVQNAIWLELSLRTADGIVLAEWAYSPDCPEVEFDLHRVTIETVACFDTTLPAKEGGGQ